MRKTYVVKLTKDGNPSSVGVQTLVQAESEFDAIKQAEKNHPGLKVASIKQK